MLILYFLTPPCIAFAVLLSAFICSQSLGWGGSELLEQEWHLLRGWCGGQSAPLSTSTRAGSVAQITQQGGRTTGFGEAQ